METLWHVGDQERHLLAVWHSVLAVFSNTYWSVFKCGDTV